MPDISPQIPVVGQPNSTEEPKIVTALNAIVAAVNNVDSAQLADKAVTTPKFAPDFSTATSSAVCTNSPAGSWKDITGTSMTFTTTVNTTDIFVATGYASLASGFGHGGPIVQVELNVDGTRDTNYGPSAQLEGPAASNLNAQIGMSGVWPISLTAGSHTVKLQAFWGDDNTNYNEITSMRLFRLSIAR